MCKRMLIVAVVCALAGSVGATTTAVWNPAANPAGTGLWSEAANWTAGEVPDGDYKAVFNVPGAMDCKVASTISIAQLVQGDNGPGGVIKVVSGGNLTSNGEWTGLGYNNTAHLIVETGGVFSATQHLWIGFTAGAMGILTLNGGTANIGNMFGLGWDGGTGNVVVNAGLLNLANWHPTDSIKAGSNMHITGGTVKIVGNRVDSINTMIANGRITGNNLVVNFDSLGNFTTIVPEPATIAFLSLGGLALLRVRSKKR